MNLQEAAVPTLPYILGECLAAQTQMGRIYGGYRTLDLLAEGGMGAIHRAEDLETGAEVALKTLTLGFFHDETARARLLYEGRATHLCRHPNVVRLLAIGENTGGEPFLVLELLEGPTLARYLRSEGPRSVVETSMLACQMLRALERIHHRGIVHRDIKTDNFILTMNPSGCLRVKIIDFGIARMKEQRGDDPPDFASNLLVGTPRYMSPEQASCDRDLDCRSDLYSLGVVLYQLVTASLPHLTTGTPDRDLPDVLSNEPVHLLERRPDLPASFAEIVMRALARERDARWPSARAMRVALERALRRREGRGWIEPGIESSKASASGSSCLRSRPWITNGKTA